ncbi:DUF1810 domain-containing protein [Granulicella sibirica]|uniref:Pyrophosphohydrolase n=1 Tax=Granulicella sibirica TaxID=2479048 RepID=A0A4Q0T531_9BACT|nr:DUF1810 domain-containing protein [Granulicella sibirica]RXH58072.1 pyrophosphohydrolase [Granulicella sibirica]
MPRASTDDAFHLNRFLEAQSGFYAQARAELAAGQKHSHWMWFIFPQIQGLGSSSVAQRYAVTDLTEAKAYLAHPTLGPRLRECTGLVNAIENRTLAEVFGYPDDLKFHSCITLFAHAASLPEDQVFQEALANYFQNKPDQATIARLHR